MAGIGVVIRKNGTVLTKEAYCGDTDGVIAQLDARVAADPTLTYRAYPDANDPEFIATPIPFDDAAARATAVTRFTTSRDPDAKLERAVLLVMLDEINVLRAALSLAPRTLTQLRNAVQAKLNGGDAD